MPCITERLAPHRALHVYDRVTHTNLIRLKVPVLNCIVNGRGKAHCSAECVAAFCHNACLALKRCNARYTFESKAPQSTHMQRIQHRPIAPDVINLEGNGMHYKLPINAWSSIATRVTGVGMSGGARLETNLLSCLCMPQRYREHGSAGQRYACRLAAAAVVAHGSCACALPALCPSQHHASHRSIKPGLNHFSNISMKGSDRCFACFATRQERKIGYRSAETEVHKQNVQASLQWASSQ